MDLDCFLGWLGSDPEWSGTGSDLWEGSARLPTSHLPLSVSARSALEEADPAFSRFFLSLYELSLRLSTGNPKKNQRS